MKVLILKPSSLGDVIHALPVLRLIKLRHPQSQVYWWADMDRLPLVEGDPDLAGVIPFDRKRWGRIQHWGELLSSVRAIRAHRFDWVIDLQALARSSLIAWFANGRFTVGLSDLREAAPAFHDVSVPRPSPAAHAVDWYLAVLPALGVPVHWDFEWMPPRPGVAEALLRKWPQLLERRNWVLFQPGARWASKRWPPERFAEVARLLALRDARLRFGVLGGPGEREAGEIVARAVPGACLNLAGETTLHEMVEWVRLSRLLVTNDTGPMHVAAALKTPVIAVFGPTEPRRTGPYGQAQRVLQARELPCVPCFKARCPLPRPLECLDRISAAAVALRAGELLRNS